MSDVRAKYIAMRVSLIAQECKQPWAVFEHTGY